MAFLDRVTLPETKPETRGRTGGFLGRVKIPEDEARAREISRLRVGAFEAEEEAVKASRLSTIARETGLDLFSRFKEAGVDAATGLFQTFRDTPGKIVEDVKEGAADLQKGDTIKGILKSGGRVAGDVAVAIFAPIGAIIGATLQLTGGQNLIDKAGNVIADKSGITDLEAFQEFAITHPNAGEDFERLTILLLGKFEKGEISPRRFSGEVKNFVGKIMETEASSVARDAAVSVPKVKGGFLEKVQEAPAVAPVAPGAPVAPRVPTTGTRPSKVAESIESRAIEKGLTEGFDGVAGFDPITVKGQAIKVADLIKNDLPRLERVMRGEEILPDGVRASAILVGLENFAIKTGNAQLLNDLAKSPLAAGTSIVAQELRLLGERVPNSPVKIIRGIKESREVAFKKNTGKTVKEATRTEVSKIKKSIKENRSGRQGWEDFIREIRCK